MKKHFKHINRNLISTASNHYENFPVASFLIPKYYRKDIAIVYWFARTADDFADEGNIDQETRLRNLANFEDDFRNALNRKFANQNFKLLNDTIINKKISESYFIDLLSAFKQDVLKKRYENFDDVLDYCRRSANPVGRILLEIFQVKNEHAKICSDKICTALQLTNFLQDTAKDYKNGRIYLPQSDLKMYNVTENMFELSKNNPNIKALLKQNLDRTQSLFDEGREIINFLSGRFKYEIKWTIAGGERILSKIRKNDFDVLNFRPILNKFDFFSLLIKSVI